ncbi:MAG: outer membrane protein assembly factor BamA [Gammaproteobacteria bacterium]|nr:outer membrane protein assembly factor BamA [Gammaproteobacteria bacterium]MBT3723822.1 outer membrane protein assembly factor BamA [Gammaproteobacteria bacterium]MBT4078912.1 outer membrane protein assembly factor BamA [Gammaproteobacteria bacterium]MBT4196384.1 outer membrane protein assembly factor BamA [Gammaproteobacteria bacterium]MBT4448195.1 outer membrane protein assembly factor BamA [Gammaproteobacteria bacterium]
MSRILLLLSLFFWFLNVHAASFVVEDIEVKGIKKIAVGTVLNYLPVKTSEVFDFKDSGKVIRELYKTGFFNKITLNKEGNTLVIEVEERPAIAKVTVEGNKEVKDDSMQDALKQIGMTKGKIYNPKLLEKLELELQQLYYSLGKYAVRLDATATELDADRVEVELTISEGSPAKVRSINLIGNHAFTDKELLDEFELEASDSGVFASDKYSSVKLAGDLENLKSFYLDHGYIQFNVDSKQVTITPDKGHINVAINLSEGDMFTVSKINLTGELIVPESALKSRVLIREGDVFSRKKITSSTKLMTSRLGLEGYAYAEVNAIPKINAEDKTVELTLLVNPGPKMRVRKVIFEGNTRTMDKVLRREMRQMEGAQFSSSKVQRSKIRLQRLKYISSVNTRYVRVTDQTDLLDIYVTVEERFSGSFTIGAGYSEDQGALFNLGLTNDNIFGTGNRLGITFNNNKAQEKYEFSYENPYYTPDGISRGFSISYTQTDAEEAAFSDYLLDQIKGSVNYSIPLSEYNKIRFSFGIERSDVTLSVFSSAEIFDFVRANNEKYENVAFPEGDVYENIFASMSFSKDSRNRLIFPEKGVVNSVGVELFSGDLDYYKSFYRHQSLFPLAEKVTLSFKGNLGYGQPYNDTTDLPFFEKYRAGGVRTVRGYDYNSLGPLDSLNDSFGGNFQVITNTEILFQIDALGGADSFRLGLYFDAGNVFADTNDFDADELRASIGISAKWFTAVGPIELSYANPINNEPGDDTKNFQFSLGAPF